MALNSSGMASEVVAALTSAGIIRAEDGSDSQDVWNVICQAITDHIVANAEVTTTVASGILVAEGLTTSTGTGTGSVT